MTKLKALFAATAVAAGMGFTTAASATFINTWQASFDNGFDQSLTTFAAGTNNPNFSGANPVGGEVDTYLQIAWGTPGSLATNPTQEQSKLVVSQGVYAGGASVDVDTNGGTEQTIGITHFNNAITCTGGIPAGGICPALTHTTLLSELTLTAIDPAIFGPIQATQGFAIQFAETKNQSPCFEGGLETVCDDIFVLLNPIALEFDLDVNGTIHHVTIGATMIGGEELGTLSNAACAEAGLGAGCIGFLTAEGQSNTIIANITITAPTEAPEPGTLAMLGALLVAGGVASRRKRV
ncbi:MAG: THxN family PEP-CTERM protein [Burkholderiales bacterium]|nr:THxN family PEP-CTERM protein [Burkholderiales bacterium]